MEGNPTPTPPKRLYEIPRMHSICEPPVKNPFFHRLEYTKLDIVKIGIMSVTIAPIRLVLAASVFMLIWPMAAFGNWCFTDEDKKKPLKGWKKACGRILRFFLRIVFLLCGFFWVKEKGKKSTSKVAPIMCVAPHSSMFDVLVALLHTDIGSGVSREYNINMPVIGRFIRFAQPVLVSREDRDSRRTTIKEIEQRCQSDEEWPQIYIFPEGTCSNRSCLINFKLGAFIPGVPVQPLCIRYPNRLDTMTWTWDGPSAWTLVWLTFCQLYSYLEIEYLPVYTPSKEEKENPKLFAHNVRQKMAECLGIPVTDHSYDDCRLMMRAGSLSLPLESGLVEFQKLHSKLGFDYDQMNSLLRKFQTIDRNGTGDITLAEFADYLHLPVSPALEEVFTLYDRNQSGTINFREYVIGLSLIAHPANTEDTLQRAFQLFDVGNKGFISQEELQMIMCSAFTMEPQEVSELFTAADSDRDGKLTYDDFKSYAEEKPEYAPLFMTYHQRKGESSSNSTLTKGKINMVNAAEVTNRRGYSDDKHDGLNSNVDGRSEAGKMKSQ